MVLESRALTEWSVAAPFTLDAERDLWLAPFVPPGRHRFRLVPALAEASWHERAARTAGANDWKNAWSQGRAACRAGRDGVITVFPQLAFVVGLHQRFGRPRAVVAWCFNLGGLYGGVKRAAARAAFARVDRFIVHSRGEIARYATWLGLPRERFRFVHLQRADIPVVELEEQQAPFVLAMGSARRDYATLFEAVRASQLPTLVVAARHALEGLTVPPNVEVRSSLTSEECRRLAQRARVNVVPVLNQETASGQVTLVEAMRMGRAVVATDCMGSEDYIEDGVTGLLVPPRSVEALRGAIDRLWEDAPLRRRLGQDAARYTAQHCSDESAGATLAAVLDEVSAEKLR
ncbi:MAG TPA: glycosyltransferase [Planctomycetota bacterium]|nr:glycosyltransferase [Planctomycetota bacterium]